MIRRIVAFGDDYGLPMLLRHLPEGVVVGLVRASIRPLQHAAIEQCALTHKLPCLIQPQRDAVEYPAFVSRLQALAPDFLMVNSYSMRIGGEVLRLAPKGGVNVHGALLPGFRGANPIQWALIEDARETGVTMHRLTEDIDGGAIVAQRKVPILFSDSWREIQNRIAQETLLLLADTLPRVLDGSAPEYPQIPGKARYFRRRNAEDGRIDWSKRVLDIYNLIRALVEPHPGAFYESKDGRVWVRQALSIQEVAALKYSQLGAPAITIDGAHFVPQAMPVSLSSHEFVLEGNAGVARLVDTDWEARTAAVHVEIAASKRVSPAKLAGALVDFARDQLGVDARGPSRQFERRES